MKLKVAQKQSGMKFSGERFIPCNNATNGELEHTQRYLFATEYCKDKVVLDIASGEGFGTFYLSQVAHEVAGVDVDMECIDLAKEKYGQNKKITFSQGTCEEIPYPDGYFDVVVSFETIEHLEECNQDIFLREIKRVLKHDGLLIISSPEHNVFQHVAPDYPFHKHELSRSQLIDALSSGFKSLRVLSQNSFFCSWLQDETTDTCCIWEQNGQGELIKRKILPDLTYIICLASNSQLPLTQSQLYLDSYFDDNRKAHFFREDGFIAPMLGSIGYSNRLLDEQKARIDSIGNDLSLKNEEAARNKQEYLEQLRENENLLQTQNYLQASLAKAKKVKAVFQFHVNNIEESIQILEDKLQAQARDLFKIKEDNVVLSRQGDDARISLQKIYSSSGWKLLRVLYFIKALFAFRRGEVYYTAHQAWQCIKNKLFNIEIKHPVAGAYIIRPLLKTVQVSLKPGFNFLYASQHAEQNGEAGEKIADDRLAASYKSEYQSDIDFSSHETDIKALAFYLPQFHQIPENDEWWGKGFTEWNNTRTSEPRFYGHYQPRVPHRDIGYYDLSDVQAIKKQVELARSHGIYGFCFYHYDFAGKRLLETPVDLFLAHPEIDFNFCLCWANESWTRTWDGLHKNVLIGQEYSAGNDMKFIADLQKYLVDPRYMRIDGKPVIMIYRVVDLPDPAATFKIWREWCRKNGIGEIEIWIARTFFNEFTSMGINGSDYEFEFPPHRVGALDIIDKHSIGLPDTDAYIYNYESLVEDVTKRRTIADKLDIPGYRGAMMGWDNSARRRNGFSVWHGFSIEGYYKWLRANIDYTRKKFPVNRRFMFINAWNEWAEGTYLEPDEKHGYANINTTSKALFDLPLESKMTVIATMTKDAAHQRFDGRIMVHAHIFYSELTAEIIDYVNRIPYKFDFVVTTDTKVKEQQILQIAGNTCKADKFDIVVTPNRGRDIAPFIVECSQKIFNYDFVCHIHTKKSLTVQWGDLWRRYLLDNLLNSPENIAAILMEFKNNPEVGLIFPPYFPVIRPFADWGGNCRRCSDILHEAGMFDELPDNPVFSAGNMFWAKVDAIKSLFMLKFKYAQFEEEDGQIKGTLAHALERVFSYAGHNSGYRPMVAIPQAIAKSVQKKKRLALFVYYAKGKNNFSPDLYYIKQLAAFSDELIFISNGAMDAFCEAEVKKYSSSFILRKNAGYDFGGWRDGLAAYGYDKLKDVDEVIFANNSCYGPVFPFEEMFSKMETEDNDFWGVTAFPECIASKRAEAAHLPDGRIPLHLQSFFMVFTHNVINSHIFREFWTSVKDEKDILRVVAEHETRLTHFFEHHGYKWNCYIQASIPMQEQNNHLVEFNAIYSQPVDFIALRCPLIKKKFTVYACEQILETIDVVAQIEPQLGRLMRDELVSDVSGLFAVER